MLLAHISDPHIGPLPSPKLRELMGKRFTGYVNWRRGRAAIHDMPLLDRIIADMEAQKADHIALTGDITNIGLAAEFPVARAFLERLGAPDYVSFVPGNHDAYVRGALKALIRTIAPWMLSDDAKEGAMPSFPYVRRRGGVALVGLSSAVPTLPFVASGTLGDRQLAAMGEILSGLGREGLCRIVMLHHPPYYEGAKAGRQLTDADAFQAVIARTGAELILHGHNHRTSLVRIRGPHKPVPILGAPSCSAVRGLFTHRAGYHLIDIAEDGQGSRFTIRTRGVDAPRVRARALDVETATIGQIGEMVVD
ncbi:metallophosphoesterase family protein [Chelatococcus asaccharovorans]|uniref:3',5'-cyclic AMP phosphodiesterase CpdA n=1 Tax=Chelatococcus asaccharovorans TaxID=28210 RepID=A0A2V3U037_9HYPH|nr:metallophosphoesterase [Chelatococcus asaccharovorans]MBS7704454.1 metallophosphoesterase [Chelatococcus asaccharovorans]PXW55665.1 3',5'-cyclic AMP phosphodiesterase CpdA [Chelatococcus asaccharovorans]CAH1663552.1 3',5'-cyclic AMP phosphodiesterase CpdA [Chelatococcus asaccharovorans]CAH1682779.1 3',5'-cyclic AMP phosphodiesterase CpdA [Chelatococcus asaccharovorans]